MKRLALILAGSAMLGVTLLALYGASAATASEAVLHRTAVVNNCPFTINVEIRLDILGSVERATCPPFGSDVIPDLWRGSRTVTVWNADAGVLHTIRRIEVRDFHTRIEIFPNGDVRIF